MMTETIHWDLPPLMVVSCSEVIETKRFSMVMAIKKLENQARAYKRAMNP